MSMMLKYLLINKKMKKKNVFSVLQEKYFNVYLLSTYRLFEKKYIVFNILFYFKQHDYD
jgi:hypothetical protein